MKFTDAPCKSCPYRCDVPSGIWDESEYHKLPDYDRDTWDQPQSLFMCHQDNGEACRGWFETHGTDLLAVRLANIQDRLTFPVEGSCQVPCFASGAEAAENGLREIDEPGETSQRWIASLQLAVDLKNDKDMREEE